MTNTNKHYGYWVFGRDMDNVNLEALKNKGITDIFLNYYAFTVHGESKVQTWINKAKQNNIDIHIWTQCFYEGGWVDPALTDLTAKKNEIKKYANLKNVKGVHLDYLRYPGNAHKIIGGFEAITRFAKEVREQNPDTFLSCAVMPENEGKKYYGQDLDALGQIMDAVIPMQYKGNYKAGTSWLASITKSFSAKANIWSGLQAYKSDNDTTLLSSNELMNDINTCLTNGASGAVIFRYGLSPDINFNGDKMTISATNINTMANSIKTYVEKNKTFPNTITVDGTQYTYGQMAYILAYAINNLGKPADVFKVNGASKSTGDTINENIVTSDYKDIAKRVANYIKTHKQCPNYATTAKSKKRLRPRVFIYMFARIIVWYNNHKSLPNYANANSGYFTGSTSTTQTTTNNCTNPYTSTPHPTASGCNGMAQNTPTWCGPSALHKGLYKFGIRDISQAQLAAWAGTGSAGTSHAGLQTAIAKVNRQKGTNITLKWYNLSDLGWKKIGELLCKPNVAVFCHILYKNGGTCSGRGNFGHYELLVKVNLSTKYVKVLNSLGSKCGRCYCGYYQDRTIACQERFIKGISQKSIAVLEKL